MITVVCPNMQNAKVLHSFNFLLGGGTAGKSSPMLLMMMEMENDLTYKLPDGGNLKVTIFHFHDGGTKINSSVIRGAKAKASCNLMP